MNFFKVTSVEDTRELLRKHFTEVFSRKEKVGLRSSLGRYTATDIISRDCVPSFNKSTVDGYAVKASSTHGASDSIPTMLILKEETEMGRENTETIDDSEAVYVPTGGMIPAGANAVVMIEYSEILGEEVFLSISVSQGENVIYKGEDIQKDDILLCAKKKIRPQNIGSFAAGGISEIEVIKKPDFYIISTGDEIKSVDEELKPGEIRNINTHTLGALIDQNGCELVGDALVKDDLELLKKEITKGIGSADILLLSGGSSVGNKDYTCRAIEELGGKILVHGISIKPGKPTIIGDIDGKLVVGLPGHPVSAMIVFKALLEELINIDKGRPHEMVLKQSIHSTPGRTTYQPVTLDENGELVAVHGKSGVISLLSKAFGYIVISSEKEGYNTGDTVQVWDL